MYIYIIIVLIIIIIMNNINRIKIHRKYIYFLQLFNLSSVRTFYGSFTHASLN